MRDKLNFAHVVSGDTLYGIIFDDFGEVADLVNSVMDDYATANRADYAITFTELGTASKIYQADTPAFLSPGYYQIVHYVQAGGGPAESDDRAGVGIFYWNGFELGDALLEISSFVDDASPNAGAFTGEAGLSSSDDFYNGEVLVFISGALQGIARKISDYTGASKTFTFNGSVGEADEAFPIAPADTDLFKILGRIG